MSDYAERDRLVLAHARLPYMVGRRLAKRLPRHVDVEDLIGQGMLGLIGAADRYRLSTGVPFDAYARQRVYGAMLDALRKVDPATRRQRACGDGPMHVSIEALSNEDSQSSAFVDTRLTPEQRAAGIERRARWVAKMRQLPVRQQLLMALTYAHGLLQREVAQEMGVSQIRISQLHAQAIRTLRQGAER